MKRLPPIAGEWIDRTQPLRFRFEGRDFTGFEGDVVSAALWAAGERVLGRSFKYHRARGILSLANHDVNVMVQHGATPNQRACVLPLQDGMDLHAVNTVGGVNDDQARWIGLFARFLPVGFYYKAFIGKKSFPFWERRIRRFAGLGTVDVGAPLRHTAKTYDFCDVLVVGGGPSGLHAALAAAAQGAHVVVVDENARAGGSGGYQIGADDARHQRHAQLLATVAAEPRIDVRCATVAAAYYADQWVPLVDADRMTKMRARSVVIASGSIEQPAVFRHNDTPGVMLAGAAQRLLYRYAVQPAARAVVLAANDQTVEAALDLAAHGVTIAALVDLRAGGPGATLRERLARQSIALLCGHCVTEALRKDDRVCGARIAQLAGDEPQWRHTQDIPCDAIVMGTGFVPAAHLLYQAGASMTYQQDIEQFVPQTLPAGVFACGKVNGVFDLDARALDGERAGSAAAAYAGFGVALDIHVPQSSTSPTHAWPIVDHPKGTNFVDFDEDLQLADFRHAAQEGYDNIELLKRFSTNGMGPSQGKHSNMNGLRILARLTNQSPEKVGTTTARPFFHPVPFSHLAGRAFSPERDTPLRARHEALDAVWMSAGVWQRPEFYARAGESRLQSVRAEAAAVRHGVGLIDVGTLGKLELIGPQAAELLERVYVSRVANLKVGMTRYAVMCDESGVLIDDGVIARLADDHFYFTTTTSGSATVYRELSRLNTMWRLDCGIVNHTGAYAGINLAGPRSRDVLRAVCDADLSAAAFPYLALREATIVGVPARLLRVGFVGEWGYEIHLPAAAAVPLWDALMAAGAAHGIRPFGVEAQRLLRLEKGHLIVGQDSDGLTTPLEAGLAWAVKWDKPFFVGQRSLQIAQRQGPKQLLVGFALDDAAVDARAPLESHLVIDAGEIAGRVTSVAYSASVGGTIGLAMVAPALAKPQTALSIRLTDGTRVAAKVVPTPFYDPQGSRQKEATP